MQLEEVVIADLIRERDEARREREAARSERDRAAQSLVDLLVAGAAR